MSKREAINNHFSTRKAPLRWKSNAIRREVGLEEQSGVRKNSNTVFFFFLSKQLHKCNGVVHLESSTKNSVFALIICWVTCSSMHMLKSNCKELITANRQTVPLPGASLLVFHHIKYEPAVFHAYIFLLRVIRWQGKSRDLLCGSTYVQNEVMKYRVDKIK